MLRKASEKDERLLFEWANDAETRRNSFNSDPIPWSVHQAWFAARIGSETARIYVARIDHGDDVGQVRFEKIDDHALIGLSIDARFRGRGYGSEVLVEGCEAIFAEWKDVAFVLGKVKRTNRCARRALLKAGFIEEDAGGEIVLFRRFRG